MTTIRPFRAEDLFKFNHINLDPLTETYNIPFYMQYVATWPSLCASFEDPNGRMMGYILGKAEGDAKLWHGHVTAVTVSPEYRRLGVAKNLMAYLVRKKSLFPNVFFYTFNRREEKKTVIRKFLLIRLFFNERCEAAVIVSFCCE